MQNNNWVQHPLHLRGEMVDLIPLEKEHFTELIALANDARIWEFYPYDGTNPEKMLDVLTNALAAREKGTEYPFVIFHKKENKIIGSSRFMEIVAIHKKLEIGSPGCTRTTGKPALTRSVNVCCCNTALKRWAPYG